MHVHNNVGDLCMDTPFLKIGYIFKSVSKKHIHFHNACLYQTGILGKSRHLKIKLATEQNLKSENRPTIFEQTPVEPKKKLMM